MSQAAWGFALASLGTLLALVFLKSRQVSEPRVQEIIRRCKDLGIQ